MTTTLETHEAKLATNLKELATDVVQRAMKGGATAAECVVREGDEFSTLVRLGQVETVYPALGGFPTEVLKRHLRVEVGAHHALFEAALTGSG